MGNRSNRGAHHEYSVLDAIGNSIGAGIFAVNLARRLIYTNRALCRMTGWEESDLLGKGPPFPFWPEGMEARDRVLHGLIEGEMEAAGFETRFFRKNGRSFDVLITASPLKDSQGGIMGWVASATDITERKELERWSDANNALLGLFSKKSSRKEYLDAVVPFIQDWSKCRGVGIRIVEKQGFVADGSYMGFNNEFWESHHWLPANRDQTVRCLMEKPGHGDLAGTLSGESSGGMFHCAGELTASEKAALRDICIRNGLTSLSVIPIRYRGEMVGAIHLADDLEEQTSPIAVEFIESMAPLIGEAVHRFNLEENIRESESRLRLLSSQLLTVQENERQRIAREIHDGLGQMLTAIKFKTENALRESGKGRARGRERPLESIIPMIRQSIEEARRIQMDLRPSILDDLGILSTLSWFSREFQTTYPNIAIEKQIEIEEEEVPDPLKTVIYRITQEAMNNIAKHSHAERVSISFSKKGRTIELVIQDNGQGFDLRKALSRERSGGGFGLSSMRERTELSGGSFSVESVPREGTTIRAQWLI